MAVNVHRPFEFGAARDIIAMANHKSLMGNDTFVFKPMLHNPSNRLGAMRDVHSYITIHTTNVPFWARINK